MNWSNFDVSFFRLKYILHKIYIATTTAFNFTWISIPTYNIITMYGHLCLDGVEFLIHSIQLYFLFYYAMAADACLVSTSIISTWIFYCKQNG